MGLTNAAQQFQQMMDDRLAGVRDIADAYVHDIVVGTKVEPGEDPIKTQCGITTSSRCIENQHAGL